MTLGHDEIRAELDRILGAASFKRSERLSRFLRFVVDSALAGKHEQLKEYVLGLEVYQKGADFDPRIDSTVRVEAARLRAKLREYYETEGRVDPVRIELPKGGYTPEYRRTEQPVSPVRRKAVAVVWIAGLLVAVSIAVLVSEMRPRSELPAPTTVRPLTTWPGQETQPCFSPDGKHVAMSWSGENDDNRDIYVKPIGEGPPVRLTTDPAPDRSPAWSPDGRYIAFVRDSTSDAGLYLVPAAGGAERLVAQLRHSGPPPERMQAPRWLDWFPDAQALVVADRDSPAEPFAIYRLSLATGEKRRLTSPPPQSDGDRQPSLSPDGGTLAFTRSLAPATMDIYIAPAGGGETRRLTFENQVIAGMAWSEDGRSIVFSSERGGTAGAGSLWRIAVANSGARLEQVPGVGPRAIQPAIARQGRLLAYQEAYQDTNLWRTPASGSGASERAVASTREEVQPDYSPDGRRIAFTSNRSGNWEIWIANADGSDPRQLTSFAGAPAAEPRWSPDGRLIAFIYRGEGNTDLYTMTPEGASIRRRTFEPSQEENPSWSKDGRWLYFASNRSGGFEIWRMAANDPAQVRQVTRGGGSWPAESSDGKHLYFRRGDDIWRMPVNGGQETRVLGPVRFLGACVPDRTGLYFIDQSLRLACYRFATGRTTPLAALGNNLFANGLTLSPDGRWLLYGKMDRAVSDIMLVENFR